MEESGSDQDHIEESSSQQQGSPDEFYISHRQFVQFFKSKRLHLNTQWKKAFNRKSTSEALGRRGFHATRDIGNHIRDIFSDYAQLHINTYVEVDNLTPQFINAILGKVTFDGYEQAKLSENYTFLNTVEGDALISQDVEINEYESINLAEFLRALGNSVAEYFNIEHCKSRLRQATNQDILAEENPLRMPLLYIRIIKDIDRVIIDSFPQTLQSKILPLNKHEIVTPLPPRNLKEKIWLTTKCLLLLGGVCAIGCGVYALCGSWMSGLLCKKGDSATRGFGDVDDLCQDPTNLSIEELKQCAGEHTKYEELLILRINNATSTAKHLDRLCGAGTDREACIKTALTDRSSLDDAQLKIQALETTNKELLGDLEACATTRDQYQEERGACNGQLRQCQEDLNQTSNQLNDCNKKHDTCNGQLGQYQENSNQLSHQLDECKGKLGPCEIDRDTNLSNYNACKAKLGPCQDDLTACQEAQTNESRFANEHKSMCPGEDSSDFVDQQACRNNIIKDFTDTTCPNEGETLACINSIYDRETCSFKPVGNNDGLTTKSHYNNNLCATEGDLNDLLSPEEILDFIGDDNSAQVCTNEQWLKTKFGDRAGGIINRLRSLVSTKQ